MSSNKVTSRFQMHMDSFRQHSNLKWKRFANIYSKFLIRFPWSILVLSLLITMSLSIYFICLMQIRSFDQNDFLISNSQARKNAWIIRDRFGDDRVLRMHQQLDLYPGLDIIIKRKATSNQTNMLTNEIIDEIRSLDKQIQSIKINHTLEYNYSSLCIKINHACLIDGNYILTDIFRQDLGHLRVPKNGYFFDTASGANGIPDFMFGNTYQVINASESTSVDYEDHDEQMEIVPVKIEEIITDVSLLRLRYSLNSSTDLMKQLAIQWEQQVLKYLNENYQSNLIEIYPSTSTALTDIIKKKSHEEGLYLTLMILIFLIIYHFLLSFQGNSHTSIGYLPFCGLLSIILSTGATFGVLTLFRVPIIEPMALLVLVMIIIDCIRLSILSGDYHRIIQEYLSIHSDRSIDFDLEELLPSIIESTCPYFLSSTLIIIIVYSLLTFITPIISIKIFCLTLVLFIFINYLVHLTFFSSCFLITLKRVSAYRHCLFCYRLSNDSHGNLINEKFSQLKQLFTNQIERVLSKDSLWKKFFSGILCLIFLLCLLSSLWLTLSIDTRLYDHQLLPKDARSLRKYMDFQMKDFNIGPVIMFVIPEPINYENEKISHAMNLLIHQCQKEKKTNHFKLLWLEHENLANIIQGKDDLQFRVTPFSQNDLIVTEHGNQSMIKASRFYCQYNSIIGDRDDLRTMTNMYGYTSESLIPFVFPYSLLFPSYESLAQIRMEISLVILFLILACFIHTYILFLSFRQSLFIICSLLMLITGTFICLYLFHQLTWNFANALWFYLLPILYLDMFLHISYNQMDSKWKYNRVLLCLIIALMVLYIFPVQSYVFRIIRHSLLYQSIICLILINLIYPAWLHLFERKKPTEEINIVMKPVIANIEGIQALTNGLEI